MHRQQVCLIVGSACAGSLYHRLTARFRSRGDLLTFAAMELVWTVLIVVGIVAMYLVPE